MAAAALPGLLLTLAACGGSGGGNNTFTPPPPAPPPLSISTTSLPDGNLSQTYSATLQASGGTGTRTWSLASGSGPLPDGLTLSSSGVISGTPTVDATFNFTVQVADSSSPQQVATRALSILIRGFTITTTSLPNGSVGEQYMEFLSTTGGTAPFLWTVMSGSLPSGVFLDPQLGEINGVPDTQGTFSFTIEAADSSTPPQTATQPLSITIDPPPPLQITTSGLPDGAVGVSYSAILQATGGTPPRSWSVSAGSLPSGLTLAANGMISGTPTASGPSSFTVQVADSSTPPQTPTVSLNLNIAVALTGRNDDIATATRLFNGTFRASISPYTDPEGDPLSSPDVDVYEIRATAGNTVTIRICARGTKCSANPLTKASPLDSVIEIVDMNGVRFTTGCRNEGTDDGVTFAPDTTPTLFDDTCLNDDITLGVVQDSKLEFQVPGSDTVTFFVRVLDFRGDARPDLLYDIIISGAN